MSWLFPKVNCFVYDRACAVLQKAPRKKPSKKFGTTSLTGFMHRNTARNAHVSHVAELQSNDMFAQFTRHCIERTNKRNHLSLKGFFARKKLPTVVLLMVRPNSSPPSTQCFLKCFPLISRRCNCKARSQAQRHQHLNLRTHTQLVQKLCRQHQ